MGDWTCAFREIFCDLYYIQRERKKIRAIHKMKFQSRAIHKMKFLSIQVCSLSSCIQTLSALYQPKLIYQNSFLAAGHLWWRSPRSQKWSPSPPPNFYPKLSVLLLRHYRWFTMLSNVKPWINIAQHKLCLHQHCLVLSLLSISLLSISIAQYQHCLVLALLSISIAQYQHCLQALASLFIDIVRL